LLRGPLPTNASELESVVEGARALITRSRQRRRVTDAKLRRVAEIVKENDFDFQKDVAEEFEVSDRTASRYIRTARERGFLEKRRTDEQRAT
jgi:DNA-binding transcriptional regulator LsrR (DeoR family)